MNDQTTGLGLKLTRTFAHPPEDVRRALTDPDLYGRWMGPEGSRTTVRELDARVGGALAITVSIPDGPTVEITGTYREVGPARIVHTWLVTGDERETVVTFELAPDGDGTRLDLTHEGFAESEDREQNEGGWAHQLDRLERALG